MYPKMIQNIPVLSIKKKEFGASHTIKCIQNSGKGV